MLGGPEITISIRSPIISRSFGSRRRESALSINKAVRGDFGKLESSLVEASAVTIDHATDFSNECSAVFPIWKLPGEALLAKIVSDTYCWHLATCA